MKHGWIIVSLAACLMLASGMGVQASARGSYGSGGAFVGCLAMDLGALNTSLQTAGFAPLDDYMLVMGGGGAGGTLSWNVGGWGGGGTIKSTTPTQEARLETALGGFSIQRTAPLGPVMLSGGLLIGGGGAELVLMHRANPTFDEAIAGRYETRFENSFLVVAPTAGMKIRMNDFIFLNLEGCYLATLGEWKFQGQTIAGLPRVGGSMVRVGLEFGGASTR
ncbi:MAG: hypothetical protein ACOX4G_11140 [Limnochordia bacterium]|jgi:hypothetical protein